MAEERCSGGVDELFRYPFQCPPAIPGIIGSLNNLTKQTPPFGDGPLDIAVAQEFIDQLVPRGLVFHHLPDHLRCTRAVRRRDAHFQVTRKISSIVCLLAN